LSVRVEELIGIKGSTVVSVFGAARMSEAIRIMQERGVGALVVVTPTGQLQGVVAEREIVEALADSGETAFDFRMSGLVPPAQPTLAPSDTVHDAMTTMTERRLRHLAVVSKGSVVGLVSIGDVVKALLAENSSKA
jgi:CBS domain-containing protein